VNYGNKFIILMLIVINTASLSAMKRSFQGDESQSKRKKQEQEFFYCAEDSCSQCFFTSKDDLKNHCALKHFFCQRCYMGCYTEESFLNHCNQDGHSDAYDLGTQFLKSGCLPQLDTIVVDMGCAKNSCPILYCQYHTKPLTTPSNLRVHLATQHIICGQCYLDAKRIYRFSTRRDLIHHCLENSTHEKRHGVMYCQDCFQSKTVKDKSIFIAELPAKLKKHKESHNRLIDCNAHSQEISSFPIYDEELFQEIDLALKEDLLTMHDQLDQESPVKPILMERRAPSSDGQYHWNYVHFK